MLKGYMARESLGTPGLVKLAFLFNVAVSLCTSLCSAKTLIFHGCIAFAAGLVTVQVSTTKTNGNGNKQRYDSLE